MSRAHKLGVLAGTGVALAGGFLLDRKLGARRLAMATHEGPVPLGSLRGTARPVTADDGVCLHGEVDEAASPEGVTVVFVHGFALNQDCWHEQRLHFRDRRRMVFFDQRSHGRSERSSQENATIDQLGRDLKTVMDALAPDEPVVLVGHSMGGMSIVALAEQHPELFGDRVVGVGLVSTTAGGQRTHKIVARFIPDTVGRKVVERGLLLAAQRDRLLELLRHGGSSLGLKLIEEFSFGDRTMPVSYVAFLDSMISETPMKVLVEFIPQFDALDKFDVVSALDAVPTWIMCGTKDRLTSIGHARKLHERIHGSHLVELEGGGHMSVFEFAGEVNRALEELFRAADDLAGSAGSRSAEAMSG